MEARTTPDQLTKQTPKPGDPPAPPEPQIEPRPADEPESVAKAAAGETLTAEDEAEALQWLAKLGDPYEYEVPVFITTPEGKKRIPWVVKALDNDTFRKIEKDVANSAAEYNPLKTAVKTVIEATVSPDLKDPAFRGKMASTELALESRFKYQSGVMLMLVDRIREISGYDPETVGEATQRHIRAVGN